MKAFHRFFIAVFLLFYALPFFLQAQTDSFPHAIASVSLMTDEYLVNLVPPSRIAALSLDADNPELSNIVQQARLVQGRVRLDAERLLQINPDLILAPDWADPREIQFLRDRGLKVEVVQTPRTWSQVLGLVVRLGQILKVPDRARRWLASIQRRVSILRQRSADVPLENRPTFLEFNEWGTSMTKGSLWPSILRLAGVRNAAADLQADRWGEAPLSLETLLTLNPDWLVLPSEASLKLFGRASWLSHLRADPVYSQLKAVRQGHVLELPERWKTTTTPYILEAAEVISHAAYPNLP
ncbi:MAG: ABC transporter substrate-binding protein [Spirochaetales bacterium]|nr:ABC transporter substrate-binding protein [Spirochaetales bacterium]